MCNNKMSVEKNQPSIVQKTEKGFNEEKGQSAKKRRKMEDC